MLVDYPLANNGVDNEFDRIQRFADDSGVDLGGLKMDESRQKANRGVLTIERINEEIIRSSDKKKESAQKAAEERKNTRIDVPTGSWDHFAYGGVGTGG